MVRIREKATNIIYYYDDIKDFNFNQKIEWMYDLISSGVIDVSYIELSNLINRNEEDSDSIQLNADINRHDFIQHATTRDIQFISVTGKYDSKPIVVGMHLEKNDIRIVFEKRNPINIEELAEKINLNHENK